VIRAISDAVQVRGPIPAEALLDPHVNVDALLRAGPTDYEIHDAKQRLARQIKDTIDARIAGQDGWSIGEMTIRLDMLDMGEVAMRGVVIIERADA